MNQTTITNGSRQVVITEQAGKFSARLYVDGGNVATLVSWKGQTMAGAKRWAKAVIESILMAEAK